jgi:hypothetical protein
MAKHDSFEVARNMDGHKEEEKYLRLDKEEEEGNAETFHSKALTARLEAQPNHRHPHRKYHHRPSSSLLSSPLVPPLRPTRRITPPTTQIRRLPPGVQYRYNTL